MDRDDELADFENWSPRLAKSILHESLQLKKGEALTIEVWTRALPWVDAFIIEARRIGAHPMVIYDSDKAFWTSVDEGNAKNLGTVGTQEWAALKETNAYVFFYGPADRTRFHGLPHRTFESLTGYEKEWFEVAKRKGIRWCRIELARATRALAKEYGVDYDAWKNELLHASLIDPAVMRREGKSIANRLLTGRSLEITHSNGTHLDLRLKGRKPLVDDGIVDEDDVKSGFGVTNVPAGVVSVALDEEFGEGTFRANRQTKHGPSKGSSDGGEWIFKAGRLVKYNYSRGLKQFEQGFLKAGENEKSSISSLSIGLNPKIQESPLFEDQERGTVSLFIGSNEALGGSISGDYNSWLFLRGADVTVDGEPLLKKGKLTD